MFSRYLLQIELLYQGSESQNMLWKESPNWMNCRNTARFQASGRQAKISQLLSLLQFNFSNTDNKNRKTQRQRKMWAWKRIYMSGQKPHCIKRSHKSFSFFYFLSILSITMTVKSPKTWIYVNKCFEVSNQPRHWLYSFANFLLQAVF